MIIIRINDINFDKGIKHFTRILEQFRSNVFSFDTFSMFES